MTRQTCAIDGCQRPARSRGWCSKHYNRWLTNGDPLKALSRSDYNQRGTCTLDGCDRPHEAKGWCSFHYNRWRRYGDPLARPNPGAKGRGRCQVGECRRPINADGLCQMHLRRKVMYGDPLTRPIAGDMSRAESLPVAPLEREVEARGGMSEVLTAAACTKKAREKWNTAFARAWKEHGGRISVDHADRFCIQVLGVHPCAIYGETWWNPDREEAMAA